MTAIRQNAASAVISRHGRCWLRLFAVLPFMILVCASVFAQQNTAEHDPDGAKAAEDTVKKVDESEENFRKRMELRDQRYRQAPRTNLTFSSQTGTEKIDQLPAASREHIREQLRDMIIASRQWKPGEDVSDYPYEPSTAAKTDAKLRQQEREAWAEQLQKYQQREAAAYAGEQAREAQASGSKGSGQKGDDREGAGQGGAKGGAGANSRASANDRAKSARDLEPYEDQEQAEEAMSTAGVSESALSFLQSKGGRMGASVPQDKSGAQPQAKTELAGANGQQGAAKEAKSSGSTDTKAPPGSLARSELAMLQGMNPDPDDRSDQDAAEQKSTSSSKTASNKQAASSDQSSGESPAAEEKAEKLAGTMAIDDLKKLDTGAATTGAEAGEPAKADASQTVEPGTMEIADLKHLQDN